MFVESNMLYKLKSCVLIKKSYTQIKFSRICFEEIGQKQSDYVLEKTWQIHKCPVLTEMTDYFKYSYCHPAVRK